MLPPLFELGMSAYKFSAADNTSAGVSRFSLRRTIGAGA
jgi:hypothetical protein